MHKLIHINIKSVDVWITETSCRLVLKGYTFETPSGTWFAIAWARYRAILNNASGWWDVNGSSLKRYKIILRNFIVLHQITN